MGRGINSGSIQIQPGDAQNKTKSERVDPQRRNKQPIHYRSRVEWIERALCRESSLREERDADDGRTFARWTDEKKEPSTVYIRSKEQSESILEAVRGRGTPRTGSGRGTHLFFGTP